MICLFVWRALNPKATFHCLVTAVSLLIIRASVDVDVDVEPVSSMDTRTDCYMRAITFATCRRGSVLPIGGLFGSSLLVALPVGRL